MIQKFQKKESTLLLTTSKSIEPSEQALLLEILGQIDSDRFVEIIIFFGATRSISLKGLRNFFEILRGFFGKKAILIARDTPRYVRELIIISNLPFQID